jgi:hypothetical protein
MLAEIDLGLDRNLKLRPGIIYLAAPYTHPDPAVRLWRYEMVTAAAAALAAQGLVVFSPLTMTHPMDLLLADNGETLGSDYWITFDTSFMGICSEMRVLQLDGWSESSGIQRELAFFKARNRPVTFMELSDLPSNFTPIKNCPVGI